MPDIAGKLFPNLTTLIVQLLSTGVLLLIFKKFLWKNVMKYFAKRADYIESTINEAKGCFIVIAFIYTSVYANPRLCKHKIHANPRLLHPISLRNPHKIF